MTRGADAAFAAYRKLVGRSATIEVLLGRRWH
jgi:hypothetical protein